MPVSVKWGRDRFSFELPRGDTLLSAIRHSIASYTQLPYNSFQIIHDGAVCADDNAPISAYYLRPNSTIAIVANHELPTINKNTEQAQIASIRAELAAARDTLLPAHAAFLTQLASPDVPKHSLAKEHSRLAELLLQALLRLDAIAPEHDWLTARADRKAAVKELQGLLDQLDSEWANA